MTCLAFLLGPRTLSSNRLGLNGLEGNTLCESLWTLESLTELDMSSNQLGDHLTADLCKALSLGQPFFLTKIALQRLSIFAGLRPCEARLFSPCLASRCRIGASEKGVGLALGRFVVRDLTDLRKRRCEAQSSLKVLDLAWNELHGEAARGVAET